MSYLDNVSDEKQQDRKQPSCQAHFSSEEPAPVLPGCEHHDREEHERHQVAPQQGRPEEQQSAGKPFPIFDFQKGKDQENQKADWNSVNFNMSIKEKLKSRNHQKREGPWQAVPLTAECPQSAAGNRPGGS